MALKQFPDKYHFQFLFFLPLFSEIVNMLIHYYFFFFPSGKLQSVCASLLGEEDW